MNQPRPNSALPEGYKLHWYEIKAILGQGGFGITYLAYDLNLEKEVAIKEYLPKDFSHRDGQLTVLPLSQEREEIYQWGLDRFISEARTLSKFEHPNIVKVHAVFEENNTGYMVMSYEKGQSLQDILDEKNTLDEPTLLSIIYPLMAGLEQVHKHHFIHRDIKPDNIFIRSDGSPALLDFGSARQALSGESKSLTILVTPGYAPVEQYYSESDEQGPWTDIYGLGATLYRAIVGKPLINAVDRSKSMLNNQQDTYVTALNAGQNNYSKAFLNAIDHAIQFKANERPQTIAQWRSEFPEDTHAGSTRLLTEHPSHSPASSKKSKTAIGFATAAAILISTGLYWFVSGDQSPEGALTTTQPTTAPIVTTQAQTIIPAEKTQAVSKDTSQQTAPLTAAPDKPSASELAALAEQQKIEKERQQFEQEKKQLAAEKKRLLAQQQAERERQQQLALLQKKQEQKRQTALTEQRILESQQEISSRMAQQKDNFEYQESEKVIRLDGSTTELSLLVAANNEQWQSTGINLERGKTYSIKAQGTWQIGGLCNPTDATGEGAYTLLCLNAGGQTVANYSHGALIAKLGKDTLPFYVGPDLTLTADRDGVLYMMSNDAAIFLSDNTGNLNVTVRLEQP